uniref:Thiamine pyrophosphate enzyme TPP-binding domain-containing protein n=1 Tax=Phenylobacterium glaciei TaxID=2803784 RepID=A0A974P469_9CAUL|nr:hypothetical protein JKL49_26275 [Phenylobacterium glaciei]
MRSARRGATTKARSPPSAPVAATTRSRRPSSRRPTNWTCRRTGGQAVGHRLLVQDPGLFPRRLPRLQHRARPHALGAHRRQPGQPRPDLSGGLRRRDSASIGFGQFAHAIRRGVNMTYIVENNGVYGLTKGQFSATSDKGSKSKKGVVNHDSAIDLVSVALQLGATFVARSFSGDKAQLVPLIKAALSHQGSAFIDCISPCIQFNNHAGSTKSFDYVRDHNEAVNTLDFVVPREAIHVDYEPGTNTMVTQHDGSVLNLHKLAEHYDPTDRISAMAYLASRQAQGEVVTGLLYVDPKAQDLHEGLETVETPLNQLTDAELIPGSKVLERLNASLR